MSRLNIENDVYKDDGISEIISDLNAPKEDKIVLFDYDSMLHHCLYSGKNELGEKNPEYTIDDIDMLKGKLTEMTLKIMNNIEKYYNITGCYIFIKGDKTFRKEIYPLYKSNRPEPNPLINILYEYAKESHEAIPSGNKEAEDLVFYFHTNLGKENTIICYVDHDLEELEGLFYNYGKNKWLKISEKQSKWNEYYKYVKGEQGDGVNLCKGVGQKFFEKIFHIDMTHEEYEEGLLKCFMKAYKNNEELAIQNMELTKQLLGLKYVKHE